jgi:D-tyrosyl-tRNA(Tyr) deacylase
MKFVIQRVTKAKCEVNHEITGAIEQGFCVLIGVAETDNEQIADKMIKKLLGMRIFSDENGKTNLSITDVNFTVYIICKLSQRKSPVFYRSWKSNFGKSVI